MNYAHTTNVMRSESCLCLRDCGSQVPFMRRPFWDAVFRVVSSNENTSIISSAVIWGFCVALLSFSSLRGLHDLDSLIFTFYSRIVLHKINTREISGLMAENWSFYDYMHFDQNATCKEFILRMKAAFALCFPTLVQVKLKKKKAFNTIENPHITQWLDISHTVDLNETASALKHLSF